jgi:hypothetical protein
MPEPTIVITHAGDVFELEQCPFNCRIELRDYDVPPDWDGPDVIVDGEGDRYERIVLRQFKREEK